MNLFVYGTLKQGYWNNRLLKDAKFLGIDFTKEKFDLAPISEGGSFPILLPDGDYIIEGEVYKIDTITLNKVDKLEGCPNLYKRTIIPTIKGKLAWVYYWPRPRPHNSQENITTSGKIKRWDGPR